MASRGSFWPPLMASLILARMLSSGSPAAHMTPSRLGSGRARAAGSISSIAASIAVVARLQRASTSGSPP